MMRFVFGGIVALTIAGVTPVHAAEKGDVKMPDTVTVAGKTLRLNGMGIREATIFAIDVYVAGLYLPEKSQDARKIMDADVPKKLVLTFVRGVDSDDITDAFSDSFKRNKFGPDIQAQLKKLNSWVTEMKDGQTMSFTYEPGKGLTVVIEGKVKGTIPGKKFQSSFLSIWLGPKPPNSGLKKGLLGK